MSGLPVEEGDGEGQMELISVLKERFRLSSYYLYFGDIIDWRRLETITFGLVSSITFEDAERSTGICVFKSDSSKSKLTSSTKSKRENH